MSERANNRGGEFGQAMVEFVILLIVLMTLLSGMVYAMRLLLFDFWAQQEARYIAFEQTDVPESAYADAHVDPINDLGTGSNYSRPAILDRLQSDRTVTDDQDVRNLLLSRAEPSGFGSWVRGVVKDAITEEPKHSPGFPFIESALARERFDSSDVTLDRDLDLSPHNGVDPALFIPSNNLEQAISNFITNRTSFGEGFCAMMRRDLGRANLTTAQALFSTPDCPSHWGTGFGVHLARTTDMRAFWLDFGDRIESGFRSEDALSETVENAVAQGFYSFYDTVVSAAMSKAIALGVTAGRRITDIVSIQTDDQINRLTTSMRTVGSIIAIGSVRLAAAMLNGYNITNQNSQDELDFEKTITDMLHADADTAGGVGFMLGPQYLPLTTLMLEPMYGGLMNGVMRNVLSNDSALETELVNNSNKEAVVTYEAGNGLFPAAIRRFNTSGRALTGRFYLVTQPWQITRRESPTGPYRQLGTEDDGFDNPSDEGRLRRYTVGLWLFPTDIPALIQPVVDLIPGASGLGDLFSGNFVFDGIDLLASGAKDFICDNPLSDIIGMLEDLPISNGDYSFPKCPAVRPAVYPHSVELEDDFSSGEKKDFAEFVDEQKKNNPRPRPEYHDSNDNAGNGGGQSNQGAAECNWTD